MIRTLGRLHAEIERAGTGTRLALRGFIDEDAHLAEIVSSLSHPLDIDLGGVERINSVGVRSWIQFIAALAGGPIRLIRCPEVIVHQFGCVSSTLGHATVQSVLAPYTCSSCHATEPHEIDIERDFDPRSGRQPPDRACPDCGGVARFDDVVEAYFMFVTSSATHT
jgi:hypothetical protein